MLRGIFLLCLWAGSLSAWGWGGLGHNVTAAIALRHLNEKALQQVREILGRDDFVQASTWADGIKKESGWQQTYTYHFMGVPDQMGYIESLEKTPDHQHEKGDVLMAILKAQTILRDGSADVEQKKYALKFFIHFMGDMHQPLHTGRPEDKGGNLVSLNWFGRQTDLHKVWDTSIMETAHQADFKGKQQSERVVWYADFLESAHKEPSCDPDLDGWLNQILSVRPLAYSDNGDSAAYLAKALPVVEESLALAGYHMACSLNSIFTAPDSIPLKERALRSRMDQAVHGSFESWIGLSPSRILVD